MKEYKSLNDLLNETPHIRLATAADNQKILDFYHQTEMKGESSSIKYGRGNDFFFFLEERTPYNLVFTLWEDNGNLEGVAVVSYRPGFIHGMPTMIGYLGDLRVSLNKKLIREWRHMFSLFINYSHLLPETHFCKYYQTVIIDNNQKAKKNLVETKIKNLKYESLMNYKMINIIGRVKLPRVNKFQIATVSNIDDNKIVNFLNQFDSQRNFGRDWNFEFKHRLSHWKNFSREQFITIKNQQHEIVAITSFWNPIATKQVITTKVPKLFKFLVPLLNLIPFIDIKPLPKENQAIDILYLNQFIWSDALSLVDQKNITMEVIDFLFDKNFSMLALSTFANKDFFHADLKFIKHQIPMTMYSVHYINPDNQEIRYPINNENKEPGFEMALV